SRRRRRSTDTNLGRATRCRAITFPQTEVVMQFRWVLVVACALLVGAFVTVRAADEAKPAADSAKSDSAAKGSGRLNQPWSKMTSLSDDQKTKIKEIHAKT